MTLLTCAAVRRRIAAFHDRELPVPELIAIEGHINGCPPCTGELRSLQAVGDLLRTAAAPGPADDWAGLQPGVISRMRAEAHESLSARAGRLLEDIHLVWIGLAAAAATFVCGGAVLSLLFFGPAERNDSLAGLFAVLGAPSGSNLNPRPLDGRIIVPSVPQEGSVEDTLVRTVQHDELELLLALSAVVTREGRIAGLSVISNDSDRSDIVKLLDAISHSRLEPARYGNAPVAVNLVWLLAHTTVKGKLHS